MLDPQEQVMEHEKRLERSKAELNPKDGWKILLAHASAGMYGEGLSRFLAGEGRFPNDYDDLREWLEIDE